MTTTTCRCHGCNAPAVRKGLCKLHAQSLDMPTTQPAPWVLRLREADLLAELIDHARQITDEDIAVFVMAEVNDVTLVTDDDGLPTGWTPCTLCGQPTRPSLVCADCRLVAVERADDRPCVMHASDDCSATLPCLDCPSVGR